MQAQWFRLITTQFAQLAQGSFCGRADSLHNGLPVIHKWLSQHLASDTQVGIREIAQMIIPGSAPKVKAKTPQRPTLDENNIESATNQTDVSMAELQRERGPKQLELLGLLKDLEELSSTIVER